VTGFVLPTRRADGGALRARVERLTALVAARVHGRVASAPPVDPALRARFQRARSLALAGSLDEAASLVDTALEDGARSLDRIGDAAAELLDAHMRRVVIALARGEHDRLRELLVRALRWDPSLTLSPAEATPQLRAAVDDARTRARAIPPFETTDLREACEELADLVLVARANADGTLELKRYDDCEPVRALTVAPGDDDAAVAARLAEPPVQLRATLHALDQPVVAISARGARSHVERAELAVGGVLLAAGVGLVAAGIDFGVATARDRARFNQDCDPMTPCAPTVLSSRGDALDRDQARLGAFVGVGAAALAAGAALLYLGARHAERRP
jgi:hypothetical protein